MAIHDSRQQVQPGQIYGLCVVSGKILADLLDPSVLTENIAHKGSFLRLRINGGILQQ